jgi:hypothetical protein
VHDGGSNVGACAFRALHEHAVGGEDFLLLATCLGLEVGNGARKETGIHKFALASEEIRSLFFSRSCLKASQSPISFQQRET